MKIARLVLAGFGGALALMTMGVARAEVVTISPDGSVERSDNAAVQRGYGSQSANNGQQNAPQNNIATPEVTAGMRYGRGPNDVGTQPQANDNNRRDRDDRNRGDRDDRRNRYRDRRGNIIINGDNTDVYINGYPGYGYPVGGYYGYRDPYFIDPGYGFPYYGGTYSSGGTTITYGNGLYGGGFGGYYGNGNLYNYGYGNTSQNGGMMGANPGMGPAWPNMGTAPGMGVTNLNPPRLPGAIYNPGRRR